MAGFHFYGSKLRKGDGGSPSETFTDVALVKSVNGPGESVAELDTTTLDNADAFQTFLPGLINGGEISVELLFDPNAATQDESTGLYKDKNDRTVRNWRLVMPTAVNRRFAFAGFIKSIGPSGKVEDLAMLSVTIKITGKPVLEAGTS